MSDFDPAVSSGAQAVSEYEDRSTGLTIFGVLTIGLGGLMCLFVGLMVLGMILGNATNRGSMPVASMIPSILMYACLAVALVWLGIGSMKATRWARALMVIFSWSWLVTGVLMTGFMLVVVPRVMSNMRGSGNQPSGAAIGVVELIIFVVFGIIFVVLPAVWTFFYNSRHVKATCEARDPDLRWTDACPLPVLGMSLWLVFGAVMMAGMAISTNGVFPLFGMFLSGFAGSVIWLLMAAVWVISALLLYNLDERGWWITIVAIFVFMLSGILTYSQHDIWEMYRLMGYRAMQIKQMKQMGVVSQNSMLWMTILYSLPFLGYLLFIKKYFGREEA